MLFVALSLRAMPPKKDAASRGPHLVRSPVIPLLRPKQQLGRLERRGQRHTHTDSHTLARIDLVQTGVGSHQKHHLTGSSTTKHLYSTRIVLPDEPLSPATSQWTLSSVGTSIPTQRLHLGVQIESHATQKLTNLYLSRFGHELFRVPPRVEQVRRCRRG